MIEIFAYGTLRDAEYQHALFGRVLPARPAVLAGWRVVVAESGFFTIVPDPAASVAGDVVMLDDDALEIADAWEDVPLYERLPVDVTADDGTHVAAYVYVRPTASRERPPENALAQHDRDIVLECIHAFREAYVRTRSESA